MVGEATAKMLANTNIRIGLSRFYKRKQPPKVLNESMSPSYSPLESVKTPPQPSSSKSVKSLFKPTRRIGLSSPGKSVGNCSKNNDDVDKEKENLDTCTSSSNADNECQSKEKLSKKTYENCKASQFEKKLSNHDDLKVKESTKRKKAKNDNEPKSTKVQYEEKPKTKKIKVENEICKKNSIEKKTRIHKNQATKSNYQPIVIIKKLGNNIDDEIDGNTIESTKKLKPSATIDLTVNNSVEQPVEKKYKIKRLSLKRTNTTLSQDSEELVENLSQNTSIIASNAEFEKLFSSNILDIKIANSEEEYTPERLRDLENAVIEKRKLLDELKKSKKMYEKQDVEKLTSDMDIWKKGCQDALADLLCHVNKNVNCKMDTLLSNLGIDPGKIGYSLDDESFL